MRYASQSTTTLLSSDAGLTVWRVTRPRATKPASFRRLLFGETTIASIHDLEKQGLAQPVNVGGLRLFSQRTLEPLAQTLTIVCLDPPTVIVCEGAPALRAALKRIASESDELPKGFGEFAKQCRYVTGGQHF